ncbi:MAG: hypothetical protein R6U89_03195 [Dehalococcoidia bacterium]
MEEMKSAMERAMERAERMGKLSSEELQKQREARYAPVGDAIARRFLEHGYTSILAEQLEKVDEEGQTIALNSALTTLAESISLDNRALTERAIQGIMELGRSRNTEQTADEIMNLFGQYSWQKKLWYEENSDQIGRNVRERMGRMGIGGSAVGEININNDETWIKRSTELQEEFDERLEGLKKSLIQSLEPD